MGLIESKPTVATGILELRQPITEKQLLERIRVAAEPAVDESLQLQTIQVAGRSVFVNANAGSDQICLIDEKTLLIGSKGQVEEVLRREEHAEPQDLVKAIQRLDFGKIVTVAAKVPPPKADAVWAVQHVKHVLVEGAVDELVRAEIVLECGDEEQAEETNHTVQAFCKLFAGTEQDPIQRAVFGESKVTRDGKDVRISGKITPAQWNTIWRDMMGKPDKQKSDGKKTDNAKGGG
jgi:hypothetical protein